jgi:hypothetical protein
MALINLPDDAENPRAVIGGNAPPPDELEVIVRSRKTYSDIAAWLTEHPVIDSAEAYAEANDRKALLELALKDMAAARETQTKPLHRAWQDACAYWKKPIDALDKLKTMLVSERMQPWAIAEKRRLEAEAAKAAAEAAEKERLAREAEAKEREAVEDAAQGVCEDVADATAAADQAFDEFKQANRTASLAERAISSGPRSRFAARKTTLRTQEVLTVVDWQVAMAELWKYYETDLTEAILTAARKYRKEHGGAQLPLGIRRDEKEVL